MSTWRRGPGVRPAREGGGGLMGALIERGVLVGGDGAFQPGQAVGDQLSAPGRDVDYHLTDRGRAFLDEFGINVGVKRPTVRYCVDWSEQRHHLAGSIGRSLLDRLVQLDWIRRTPATRAVHITEAGHEGIAEIFGIDPPE